jgi:pimeloyl-[acyl-carrier protein] methyl ester esterase
MTQIHLESYGEGPVLVLLHGWSMHSGIWRPFAKQLAQHFQVHCLDLPGHGRSSAVTPYTLENIAEVLQAVVPAQQFHLLGWSLGATVALDMAIRYPQRILSVTTLAGNPCFVANDNWPGMRLEVLESFVENLTLSCRTTLMRFLALQVNGLDDGKVLLKQLKSAIQECEAPSVEVLQGGLAILKHYDMTAQLKALRCPLQFILGDKDTLVPVQTASRIAQLLPQAKVSILKQAGHVPFLTHQQQIINAMQGFV